MDRGAYEFFADQCSGSSVIVGNFWWRKGQIADIRDELAYNDAHIENAVNVNNNNLQDFIDNTDVEAPVLIYCYHGNLSQGAAAYLAEQGFKHAYSLDGGYDAWKNF